MQSSPHTRGWSQHIAHRIEAIIVFPAYAGVVPRCAPGEQSPCSLPRIRGGGPRSTGPRARAVASSPHTRGWSLTPHPNHTRFQVFPAYAGVVPRNPHPPEGLRRLPRIRGGGPFWAVVCALVAVSSPHTRGWSLQEVWFPVAERVFPAYAGVVRSLTWIMALLLSLPRIRGGGPPCHGSTTQSS